LSDDDMREREGNSDDEEDMREDLAASGGGGGRAGQQSSQRREASRGRRGRAFLQRRRGRGGRGGEEEEEEEDSDDDSIGEVEVVQATQATEDGEDGELPSDGEYRRGYGGDEDVPRAEDPDVEMPEWEVLIDDEEVEILKRAAFQGTEGAQGKGRPDLRYLGKLTADDPPIFFVHLFLKDGMIEKWKESSNEYAREVVRAGMPGGKYLRFVPFTNLEICKFLSVYIIASLRPMPQMRLQFADPDTNFVFGDARVRGLFERKHHRFQEARSCFHIAAKVRPETDAEKADPFFKTREFIDELRSLCERLWLAGEFLAGDEMSIEIQGRLSIKITFRRKKRKEGVQVEALCENGYVWTFHFRSDPLKPDQVSDPNLCTTTNRALLLLSRLKHAHHKIFYDNYYMSLRFARAALNLDRPQYVGGTVRVGQGRGVPDLVAIDLRHGHREGGLSLAQMRQQNLHKAAYTTADGVVAFSIIDKGAKPTTFMGTVWDKVGMVALEKEVFNPQVGEKVAINVARSNVQHSYNHHMNGVDVADQYREEYRMDGKHVRHRKWWMPVFLFLFGTCLSNGFLIYKWVCGRDKKTPLSHAAFLQSVAKSLAEGDRGTDPRTGERIRRRSSSRGAGGGGGGEGGGGGGGGGGRGGGRRVRRKVGVAVMHERFLGGLDRTGAGKAHDWAPTRTEGGNVKMDKVPRCQ
jgi:uncharacterized membrane protein YgcG